MDFRNCSIPLEKITSMDMNKAIQRSLTKACARHGLGLYIYAGEDLPDSESQEAIPSAPAPSKKGKASTPSSSQPAPQPTPASTPANNEPKPLPNALMEIEAETTVAGLMAIWNGCPHLQTIKDFREALSAKRQQIEGK